MTEQRKGKVPAKAPDSYLFKQTMRAKVIQSFAGMEGTMKELESEEGQAKVAMAQSDTEEFLGYTLEDAEENSLLDDLYSELQWAKPSVKKSGEEELESTEVEI